MYKKHSQSIFTIPNSQLEEDFAIKILEKELALDESPSLKLLEEIVLLYMKAIEYYESQKDSKSKRLLERMKGLLSKSSMSKLLQVSTAKKSKIASERSVMKSKLRWIIERNETKARNAAKKAIVNIFSQESNLQQKLNQRKKQYLKVRLGTSDNSSEDYCFYELTLPPHVKAQLERQLENVYEQQTTRTVEVLEKYKRVSQAATLNSKEQNDLVKAMQIEIDLLKEEFDAIRNSIIQTFRSQTS